MNSLFSEYIVNGVKIKNRIVMPPIVCFGEAKADGLVTEKHVRHYEVRARGGVGLIIVEATCITPEGRLANSQLGLWSDEQIDGMRKITEACHRYGAAVMVQIHHAGYKTRKNLSRDIVAPSDYVQDGISARALALEEIYRLQEEFVMAAMRAKEAGFDGVELHGAHGYLISQFFSPMVNKREDEYGGCLENRARFAAEIIKKIKASAGEGFIVGVRMGCNEPSLEDGIGIAKELQKAGADMLHVSSGIGSDMLPRVPEDFHYNWIVYGGTEIKKNVNIPVIVVNGIRTPERADYLIRNGLADFTAIGRGLLVDAEWANKAAARQEVVECLDCQACKRFRSIDNCTIGV